MHYDCLLESAVATLAARDVEGRSLQQRVAQLEVLVNGMSGGFGNGLGSLTGGGVSGAGNVVVGPAGPHCRTPPRVTQAPSGGVLLERRSAMPLQHQQPQHTGFDCTQTL